VFECEYRIILPFYLVRKPRPQSRERAGESAAEKRRTTRDAHDLNLSSEPCRCESRPVELGPAAGSEFCAVVGNFHCEA
jgi:hypothetical protein